ncbi:MAG: RsmB/NOP family class I SAM-dependent RNA methyltransferase [Bacteroidota bacterium]|jgi:16S rRNA (cytosine967-C5)-methyltransferase
MKKNTLGLRRQVTLLANMFACVHSIVNQEKHPDAAYSALLGSSGPITPGQKKFLIQNAKHLIRYRRLLESATGLSMGGTFRLFEFWQLYGTWLLLNEIDYMRYPSLRKWDATSIRKKLRTFSGNNAITESYPEWLWKRASSELGARWPALANALNVPALRHLRVNTLLSNFGEVWSFLEDNGYEPQSSPLSSDAVILHAGPDIFESDLFFTGRVEVQDAASQFVSNFCGALPGMMVADVCAGHGGKSLHLAQIMENRGEIWAYDIHRHKTKELSRRAARAGISIIRETEEKNLQEKAGQFDLVLLDAPCSGTGVFRRNPETKWMLNEDKLASMIQLQASLLEQYLPMVKPGGMLVYAVCSVLPSEGKQQVKKFLSAHPECVFSGEAETSPEQFDCDGFYVGKILRKGE